MFDFGTIMSFAGPVLSGIMGKDSAEDAANIQAGAADRAAALQADATKAGIAEQRRQFDLSRGDILAQIEKMAPYLQAGTGAVTTLAGLLGITPSSLSTPDRKAFTTQREVLQAVNEANFNPEGYLRANPDVARSELYASNPLGHWQTWGRAEPRQQYVMQDEFDEAGYNAALKTAQERQSADLAERVKSGLADSPLLKDWMISQSPILKNVDPESLARDFTLEDFEEDPGYQFRLSQGEKAIERAARARGTYMSPMTVKELMRYGSGLASEEYGNAWNRDAAEKSRKLGIYGDEFNRDAADKLRKFNFLSGLAGSGQAAAGTGASLTTSGAQLGANTANSVANMITGGAMNQGNLLMQGANARGAAAIAGSNAFGGGVSSAVNNWQQKNLLDRILNTGSSFRFSPTSMGGTSGGWNPVWSTPGYGAI